MLQASKMSCPRRYGNKITLKDRMSSNERDSVLSSATIAVDFIFDRYQSQKGTQLVLENGQNDQPCHKARRKIIDTSANGL